MRFNLTRLFALAILVLLLSANSVQSGQEAAGTSAAVTDIQISFKLDSRITRGMYMGDRWVSSATYVGIAGETITVEARVLGIDAKGKPMAISPTWTPADPDMVAVSPGQGNAVKITVKRAGQSSLRVVFQGVSRELDIKAIYEGNAFQVEISQVRALAAEQKKADGETISKKEKMSNSLGYETGRNMKNSSVDLDFDIYIKAFVELISIADTSR